MPSYTIDASAPVNKETVVAEVSAGLFTGNNFPPVIYAELLDSNGDWQVTIRYLGASGLVTTVYELDSGTGPEGDYTEVGGTATCSVAIV